MASIPNKSTPQNSDGENYSVDEMMARLKRGERQKRRGSSDEKQKGQLVTREDGSQAIKVRQRKRRSKQPPKTPQTNPKLKWTILGSVSIIGVLLVVTAVFVITKFNGRKFKTATESTICELSGAEQTSLTQLRVSPVSAKATNSKLSWGPQSFYDSATFNDLHAKIKATSFFTKEWTGEEIVAATGTVHLKQPTADPVFDLSSIASPYNFGTYRCNQLNLIFGSGRDAPSMTDLQVSLRDYKNGQHQLVFHNGTMKVKNWPSVNLTSAVAIIGSQGIDIDALLSAGESHDGELTLKGHVSKRLSSPATLDVTAKNFPIEEILGNDLGRLLQGDIESDNGHVSFDYSKPSGESLSFSMPFQASELRLGGLPMLKDLNKLIGNSAYSRPSFYRSSGVILRTSEGLILKDLELINNSLLLIRGDISVATDGALAGTLAISIPQSSFDSDKAPAPFTGPSSGFYHANVSLRGTIRTPSDNLHEQIHLKRNQRTQTAPLNFQNQHEAQPTPEAETQPTSEDFDELIR